MGHVRNNKGGASKKIRNQSNKLKHCLEPSKLASKNGKSKKGKKQIVRVLPQKKSENQEVRNQNPR